MPHPLATNERKNQYSFVTKSCLQLNRIVKSVAIILIVDRPLPPFAHDNTTQEKFELLSSLAIFIPNAKSLVAFTKSVTESNSSFDFFFQFSLSPSCSNRSLRKFHTITWFDKLIKLHVCVKSGNRGCNCFTWNHTNYAAVINFLCPRVKKNLSQFVQCDVQRRRFLSNEHTHNCQNNIKQSQWNYTYAVLLCTINKQFVLGY